MAPSVTAPSSSSRPSKIPVVTVYTYYVVGENVTVLIAFGVVNPEHVIANGPYSKVMAFVRARTPFQFYVQRFRDVHRKPYAVWMRVRRNTRRRQRYIREQQRHGHDDLCRIEARLFGSAVTTEQPPPFRRRCNDDDDIVISHADLRRRVCTNEPESVVFTSYVPL